MAMRTTGSAHSAETIEQLAIKLCEHGSPRLETTRAGRERDFKGLLALLGPRIAQHIRRYGLTDMREDAEQAAAIGVHRALQTFDPDKASFSTHVTWQIRGELQSLRHRVRLDQRRSARGAGITTVSLDALRARVNGRHEESAFEIVDDHARVRTERAAADRMTLKLIEQLLDRLNAPAEERAILFDHLFDNAPTGSRTAEQRRQVVRRTMRNCAKVATLPTR